MSSRIGPGNHLKLLSDAHLSQIEAHLGRLLDQVLHAPGLAPLNRVICSYVLSGGKRVRPQLCAWTYLNFRKKRMAKLPESLLDLACAWEFFHAFLLCHDDIIDGADRRREQASLHRQLSSLDHNCPRFGINLGIVAGDLLFSSAMRLWHELDLPAKMYRDQLKLFSRVACTTGFGQAIDICQSHVPLDDVREETLLREYHWKTAAYTFEGPMLSGAIAAGADAKTQRTISTFALALGQAYQLQNDLLDLATPSHEGCDLLQGKRTMTLILGRRAMSASGRRSFDRQLGALSSANGETMSLCESLRLQLRDSGGTRQTRELIDSFLAIAASAANGSAAGRTLRAEMKRLLASLSETYFAPI
jgi:geranylgeranyl diphosphate synthase, type I